MDRWEIAKLIEIARSTYKMYKAFRDQHCEGKISDESYKISEPLFTNFLRLRYTIRELCIAERKRRQSITHVWTVYYKSQGLPVKPVMVGGKLITGDPS